MNNFKSIVFYFPHHDIGGVPALFLRLAEFLKNEISVFIADYSDGYMAKNLPTGVGLIRIDKEDKFPEDSVYVFQSFLPWRFPCLSKIDLKSRVLFWNLHPQNFDPSIYNEKTENRLFELIAKFINKLAFGRRKKIASFVNYLFQHDSLVIMDRENLRSTCELIDCVLDLDSKIFLPVPTPPTKLFKQGRKSQDVICCGWVGRLADFKYRILEHLINRLDDASIVLGPIKLVMIGDGEYESYLKKVASIKQNGNFQVEFVGQISASVLPQYLVENIDILFSMGTSALEGAALRIPVFLTDYSYSQINGKYKFSLLHKNHGFCLGEEITPAHFEKESTLEDSIRRVMGDYEMFGDECYDYWKNNFSIDVVGPKFMMHCKKTRGTFEEINILGFFKPEWVGLILRSAAWGLRGRYSNKPIGFRHDC